MQRTVAERGISQQGKGRKVKQETAEERRKVVSCNRVSESRVSTEAMRARRRSAGTGYAEQLVGLLSGRGWEPAAMPNALPVTAAGCRRQSMRSKRGSRRACCLVACCLPACGSC
jgi:hypothetical protein